MNCLNDFGIWWKTYFQITFIISEWKHIYRFDFSLDFDKFDFGELKETEIN